MLCFVAAIVFGSMFSACALQSAKSETPSEATPPSGDRQAVLVELFTSEGCSSCPPADRALAFLEKQQPVTKAEIVTLAFHVDYWDRLGWKDRFSSPLFSRRQEGYAHAFKLGSNYTPQMVVDGAAEFVGSDTGRASTEILKATGSSKADVVVVRHGEHASVKIASAPDHRESTVFAAIAEDGVSTRVEGGENSGKTLEHVSVVRELKTLGTLNPGQTEFQSEVDVKAPSDAKKESLKVVVFVQENGSRRVLGVGRTR
jgi:hypothetical protein